MTDLLYITESSGFGGNEKYLLDLAGNARERLRTVAVALPFRDYNATFRHKLAEKGVEVIQIEQTRADYPRNLIIAYRALRPFRDTLLHFSLPSLHSCRWLMLAAALLRCRYVITEHSVIADPYRSGAYVLFAQFAFNPLRRFLYRRAAKVITVSRANRDLLVDVYGMPADRIEVIHNGIDLAPYEKKNSGTGIREYFAIPGDATLLVTVGRLAEEKGHRFLLEAMARLAGEHTRLHLLLVGEGPLMGATRELAASLGLSGRVHFAGYRNDIPDILAAADMFVLPSLLEGFPFSVMEAMAAAKPVVASDIAGVGEAVIDGETGLLCRPGDAAALADKLRLLLQKPERIMEMGNAGKRRALAEFALDTMVQRTWEVYGWSR